MKKIDSGYDDILNVNYELYAVKYSELVSKAKSWYKGYDLSMFDERTEYANKHDNGECQVMKMSGIVSNHFYALKEGDECFLLDGFNRLFTDYGKLTKDPLVYIKIITDRVDDNKLMAIMFMLNMWKLSGSDKFEITNYLDRGFRLLIKKKFNISLFYHKGDGYDTYQNREQYADDIRVLDHYFRDEHSYADYFKLGYTGVIKLMSNLNIVNDFRQIIRINKYKTEPFKNYHMFVEGYVRFLSRRRLEDDNNDHQFETYIELLEGDKTFYKKLQGMSGTDSTRQNIYKFFRDIEDNLVL